MPPEPRAGGTSTPTDEADDSDATDDADESAAQRSASTHTANPASTLKGENGSIHSEGRNSVGDARRSGEPKPSQAHPTSRGSEQAGETGDPDDDERPSGRSSDRPNRAERTSPGGSSGKSGR